MSVFDRIVLSRKLGGLAMRSPAPATWRPAVAALLVGWASACGGASPEVDAGTTLDASLPADAEAPFVPIRACATDDEALAGIPGAGHVQFHDSAFYFRADTSVYRVRGTALPRAMVIDGQSYSRLGTDARISLLRQSASQIVVPSGHGACPGFMPLSLYSEVLSTGPTGLMVGALVVLVDDLTGELSHVIAEGDAYSGSVVSAVTLFAEGDCGDLALLLSLADGRTLLVRRDAATGSIDTLLTVSPPGLAGGGQVIPGTSDRFVGNLDRVTLEGSQALITISVENAQLERLGHLLGSVDFASGEVTCHATDTDVPCWLTGAPGTFGDQWSQAGDTVATTKGEIARGGLMVAGFTGGGSVAVCPSTQEVYFLGQVQRFLEVYVVRRDHRIERVTRSFELDRSGELAPTWSNGFFLGPACEVILDGGNGNAAALWSYWADGTMARLPDGYYVAGFDADGGVGMGDQAGHLLIARRPSGDCKVPPL